jgi:hypothetical protein
MTTFFANAVATIPSAAAVIASHAEIGGQSPRAAALIDHLTRKLQAVMQDIVLAHHADGELKEDISSLGVSSDEVDAALWAFRRAGYCTTYEARGSHQSITLGW